MEHEKKSQAELDYELETTRKKFTMKNQAQELHITRKIATWFGIETIHEKSSEDQTENRKPYHNFSPP